MIFSQFLLPFRSQSFFLKNKRNKKKTFGRDPKNNVTRRFLRCALLKTPPTPLSLLRILLLLLYLRHNSNIIIMTFYQTVYICIT